MQVEILHRNTMKDIVDWLKSVTPTFQFFWENDLILELPLVLLVLLQQVSQQALCLILLEELGRDIGDYEALTGGKALLMFVGDYFYTLLL